LLQRTAATVLRGIGRITGGGFLEQVAVFVSEMNELFGGWRDRAEVVASALRGEEVGYLLVTTPEAMSLREVMFFAERLRSQGMRPSAYVVNRVHGTTERIASERDMDSAVSARGLDLDSRAADRIVEAARQEHRTGTLDQLSLTALVGMSGEQPPIVHVPDFPKDIHDVSRLRWVADALASG
jgi:anion-transporting  ArsA/GET3 family ATPase